MKIAISGTVGIGKTTLTKALGDYYNVPIINEGFVPLMEALSALSKIPPSKKTQQLNASKILFEAMETWTSNRAKYYYSNESFVEDRFCIDLLFFITNRLMIASDSQLKNFINKCVKYTSVYDMVIILPPINIPESSNVNEDNLIRNNSLAQKIRSHSLLIGLAEQFCSAPKLYVPYNCKTIEQRIEYISLKLAKNQAN